MSSPENGSARDKTPEKAEMGAKQRKESGMSPQMSPSTAATATGQSGGALSLTAKAGQGEAFASPGIRDPGRPSLARLELLNFENCNGYLSLRWHLLSLSAKNEIYTQESQNQLGVVSSTWPQPGRHDKPIAGRMVLSPAEPRETSFSHGEH